MGRKPGRVTARAAKRTWEQREWDKVSRLLLTDDVMTSIAIVIKALSEEEAGHVLTQGMDTVLKDLYEDYSGRELRLDRLLLFKDAESKKPLALVNVENQSQADRFIANRMADYRQGINHCQARELRLCKGSLLAVYSVVVCYSWQDCSGSLSQNAIYDRSRLTANNRKYGEAEIDCFSPRMFLDRRNLWLKDALGALGLLLYALYVTYCRKTEMLIDLEGKLPKEAIPMYELVTGRDVQDKLDEEGWLDMRECAVIGNALIAKGKAEGKEEGKAEAMAENADRISRDFGIPREQVLASFGISESEYFSYKEQYGL